MPAFSELIFILILALVLIGPKQLPEVARNIARFLNQLKNATDGVMTEIRNEAQKAEEATGIRDIKEIKSNIKIQTSLDTKIMGSNSSTAIVTEKKNDKQS